jgi:hypothetical protein
MGIEAHALAVGFTNNVSRGRMLGGAQAAARSRTRAFRQSRVRLFCWGGGNRPLITERSRRSAAGVSDEPKWHCLKEGMGDVCCSCFLPYGMRCLISSKVTGRLGSRAPRVPGRRLSSLGRQPYKRHWAFAGGYPCILLQLEGMHCKSGPSAASGGKAAGQSCDLA